MPVEITMPQLSDTMSEGTVVKWLKKEGDKVKASEIIAEIETDKATMEQESFDSGTLAVVTAKEGQKVKVGDLIAVLASAGEKLEDIKRQYAGRAPAAKPSTDPKALATAGTEADSRMESQRKEARQQTTTAAAASPAKPAPASAPAAEGSRIRVSPLARKIAQDRGVELSQIKGSGPAGRIVQRDVESATGESSSSKTHGSPSVGLVSRVASGQKETIPLTKIRATIAQRLQQSKQQVPHFYETIDIDVTDVAAMRESMNKHLEKEQIRLSLSDFIAKALSVALLRHPNLNAHFNGSQITRFGDVHLGMAVALPDGLIVPVLKNINQMGLKEIRQRSADLVERARSQKLKGDEMTGATFTVSNLGAAGIREFSAIINPPEVAILAIGAAEKRPVYKGDALVPRTIMSVTISADHRAVDGASAAEFLATLKELLQEPAMMLM